MREGCIIFEFRPQFQSYTSLLRKEFYAGETPRIKSGGRRPQNQTTTEISQSNHWVGINHLILFSPGFELIKQSG